MHPLNSLKRKSKVTTLKDGEIYVHLEILLKLTLDISLEAKKKVNIFKVNWLHQSLKFAVSNFTDSDGFRVDLPLKENRRRWDDQSIIDICGQEWVDQINPIKTLEDPRDDMLTWTATQDGNFSMK